MRHVIAQNGKYVELSSYSWKKVWMFYPNVQCILSPYSLVPMLTCTAFLWCTPPIRLLPILSLCHSSSHRLDVLGSLNGNGMLPTKWYSKVRVLTAVDPHHSRFNVLRNPMSLGYILSKYSTPKTIRRIIRQCNCLFLRFESRNDHNGPNTSSLHIFILSVQFVNIVGDMKNPFPFTSL